MCVQSSRGRATSGVAKAIPYGLSLICILLWTTIVTTALAQCDTIQVAQFVPFDLYIGGGGFEFDSTFTRRAIVAAPSLDTPLLVGGEVFEIHVGPDGQPLVYFNGEGLYAPDGTPLAGGQKFGDYNRFGVRNGASYSAPVLVPDANPELLHIFYGAVLDSRPGDFNFDLFERPAWYARYHIGADTLQVIDSVLYRNHPEGWVGLRAADERSWWLVSRAFNPARAIAFKFRDGEFLEVAESRLPRHPNWRSSHHHWLSDPTVSRDGRTLGWMTAHRDSLRSQTGQGGGEPYGSFEVASFDCSTGLVTDFRVLDSMRNALGPPALSPSGQYLYYQHAPLLSGNGRVVIDTLYRYNLYDSNAQREMVADSVGKTAWRGPDDRVYTVRGWRDRYNGYIDYPDRWTSTPERMGGMEHVSYPQADVNSTTSFLLHRPLVDLQDLRRPTVRGPNVTDCDSTASYLINESCFYAASGIRLDAGPGVAVESRNGANFSLAFAADTTISPVRYVALAHEHPCRTYRDTAWMYVEGCTQACTPVATSAAVQACDSAYVHGRWVYVSGSYEETYANVQGCDSTSIVEVQLDATPSLPALPTDTLLVDGAALLLDAGASQSLVYAWSPPEAVDCTDCPAVRVSPSFAGRLTLNASNGDCSAEASLSIEREAPTVSTPTLAEFMAPDAFSPNNDGFNDVFEVALPIDAALEDLSIYDRWGQRVYALQCSPCLRGSNGLVPTWDGQIRGRRANPNVYAYLARVRYADGREVLVEGDVTLIR